MGTTTAFFKRYRYGDHHPLAFAEGRPFNDLYDAVVGADVAKRLHYQLGHEIVVAHGIGGFLKHKDKPFRISGVLQRTGTPVDGTVIVSLAAIEAIHVDWKSGALDPNASVSADEARKMDLTPKTITAFMLGLKTRMATFAVQRTINDYPDEPLLAILPGVALEQLWSLVGIAENALRLVSALVVLAGLTGMLTALLASLNERRREMAILRAVGARVRFVFSLLLIEAITLTVAGCVLGLAAVYLAVWATRDAVAEHLGVLLPLAPPSVGEWQLLATVLIGGALIGCLPAAMAYRRVLIDGLSLRT
jgi:putative ABC transport system permease protein